MFLLVKAQQVTPEMMHFTPLVYYLFGLCYPNWRFNVTFSKMGWLHGI